MTKLIMGIGIPGSGKTTVLKSFAEKNNYQYICPDDIRAELTGEATDQSKNAEVWAEARRRLSENLLAGETVVFDATFANHNQRQDFINFAKDNGSEKIEGIFADTSLETAKERNQSRERVVPEYVLERMEKSIRDFPPEIADGFDAIFTLDEQQNLVSVEMNRENQILRKEFSKLR